MPELPVVPVVEADEAPEPVLSEPRADVPDTEIASEIDEVEQLADALVGAGAAARKVTVLGTASSESIALTALTLARLMARQAKVVVVDLAASSPMMSAASVDPTAPGLAELMQGEASFTQIITRDRLSRVHLVSAGRPGFDRAQLQSPRLTLAIDALLRVYDHVLLDAGTASDLPAELLTSQARAVVVPERVDGAGCARADVRSAQGGGLLRGDDAERAVSGPRTRSSRVRAWWRRNRFVGWAKRSVPTIQDDGVDGGHGAIAPLPTQQSCR